MQAAKQDGSGFVPTLNGGSFASTRVPVVPSLNARAIGDLVKNWNLNALAPSVNAGSATAMNNAKRQKSGGGGAMQQQQRGMHAMVKVIDGESMLVNRCLNERGHVKTSNEVNVALILKELPAHVQALLMANDEEEAKEWQRRTMSVVSDLEREEEEENAFGFGEYLMNSLDVLKRVVSLRSLRSVKHYFEKIGYDPTPAVLNAVLCVLRRISMMDTKFFSGRSGDDVVENNDNDNDNDNSNNSLELKCGIMKTCVDIVTGMWEQDLVKCAAELATYPVPTTTAQKENNRNVKETHGENMLMAFYDAAYAMTREVYATIDDEKRNISETEEFRAFLDTFASFAFSTEIVEYVHHSGGKSETMRMVRLALALLQYASKENSNLGDTELWTRLWYTAKGAQCLRTICTADVDNESGETLYDKYLHDVALETSNDFEKAANIVARDCLKLATECAALAFAQALDAVYPKYNAPAFFGSFGMNGNGDSKRWRVFATLARCCEVLGEDSEVRDAVISALIVPLAKFMSNVVRGRSGDGSKKIFPKPAGTFFVIFEEVRIRGGTQKATETVKLAWMFIYGTIASAQAAPFMKSKSFGKEFALLLKDASSENPDIHGGAHTAEHVRDLLSELHDNVKSLVGAENSKLFETFLAEL